MKQAIITTFMQSCVAILFLAGAMHVSHAVPEPQQELVELSKYIVHCHEPTKDGLKKKWVEYETKKRIEVEDGVVRLWVDGAWLHLANTQCKYVMYGA